MLGNRFQQEISSIVFERKSQKKENYFGSEKKIKLEKQKARQKELVIKLDLYIGKSVCYKTDRDRQTDTIGTKS